MKQVFFTLAICIGTGFLCNNPIIAQCTGVRPDINSLTAAEREDLRDAIMDFLTDGVNQSDPNVNAPEDYPQVGHHTGHLNEVHFTQTTRFLTWHRWFVQSLEYWLLEHGHAEFVPLPAWNPTTPIPAEFFNNTLAKLPNADGFPNLTDDTPSGFNFSAVTGSNKCNLFSDPDNFADAVENQHNTVHNNIGGTMAGLFTSPGAAIFWPWHAWVDDVWYCYQLDCMNLTSDLYVRDEEADNGTEPSEAVINWISPDIWVRNTNDGFQNQQSEDLFQTPGATAFVYIRVWNRGTRRHPNGQGDLDVYWAQASAGLSWPSPWDGQPIPGLCQPPNEDLPLGGFVGSQPLRSINEDFVDFTHNNIVIRDYTIYEFEWQLPDPDKYKSCFDDEEWLHRHFCILARIEGDDNDPIVDNGVFRDLLNNNNDVALKNITIFGDGQQVAPVDIECLFFGNHTNQVMNDVRLRIAFPATTDEQLLQNAEIQLIPDDATRQEWQQNGMQGTNVNYDALTGGIKLNAPNAEIRGIALNSMEIHRFCLKINPLQNTEQIFAFDIIQYNGIQINNGERYYVGLKEAPRGSVVGQSDQALLATSAAEFLLYPNPASESLTVSWSDYDAEKQIEVIDNLGRVVTIINGFAGNAIIDVTKLPTGLYLVRMTDKVTRWTTVQKVNIE